MPSTSRARLTRDLTLRAQAALDTARAAHAAAMEGATHSEARAENDKDTRGLEQSYLARGLATRVVELEGALGAIAQLPEAAGGGGRSLMGAVITAEDDAGKQLRYYLAPWGGGEELPGEVVVVTPSSPIGRALLGRQAGDEVEVQRPGGARTLTLVAIM